MKKSKTNINQVEDVLDVPRSELIKANETIHIGSIFEFKGGCEELFPFLFGCDQKECTVIFDNEQITVFPKSQKEDIYQNFVLSIYAMIAKSPKIADDYMRYLNKGNI